MVSVSVSISQEELEYLSSYITRLKTGKKIKYVQLKKSLRPVKFAEETDRTLKGTIAGGAVAHTCNPRTLGSRGGWLTRSRDPDQPGQHDETQSLLKIQN